MKNMKPWVWLAVIVASLLNAALAMGYIYTLPVFAKDVFHLEAAGYSKAMIGALWTLLKYRVMD